MLILRLAGGCSGERTVGITQRHDGLTSAEREREREESLAAALRDLRERSLF